MSISVQAQRTTKGLRAVFERASKAARSHSGHDHSSHAQSRTALRLGFLLTIAILLVEVVGAILSHSLALFSDAGHVLTDTIALGLAWFAAAQAERPSNQRRTFGYHRLGILAALFNGLTLIGVAVFIGYEAYQRLRAPVEVHPNIMMVAAIVAIAVNLFIASRLHGSENLNSRAAMLHAIGDIGASLAVVVGAVIIALTNASWVDPVISFAIAALIALGSLRLIWETVDILMESTPADIATDEVAEKIRRVDGVRGVHDLHVWTITSGIRALSSHVIIDDIPPSASAVILNKMTAMLSDRYHISHATIQFESVAHGSHKEKCACGSGANGPLFCALTPDDCAHHDHDKSHSRRHPRHHTHRRATRG